MRGKFTEEAIDSSDAPLNTWSWPIDNRLLVPENIKDLATHLAFSLATV